MKKRVASRLSDASFIGRLSQTSHRDGFIRNQKAAYLKVNDACMSIDRLYRECLGRTEAVRKELEPLISKASVMMTLEWGLKYQDWVTMNDCLNSHKSTYNNCLRLNSRWEQSIESYNAKRDSVVGHLNQLKGNPGIDLTLESEETLISDIRSLEIIQRRMTAQLQKIETYNRAFNEVKVRCQAINGITQSLVQRLTPYGIFVNAIQCYSESLSFDTSESPLGEFKKAIDVFKTYSTKLPELAPWQRRLLTILWCSPTKRIYYLRLIATIETHLMEDGVTPEEHKKRLLEALNRCDNDLLQEEGFIEHSSEVKKDLVKDIDRGGTWDKVMGSAQASVNEKAVRLCRSAELLLSKQDIQQGIRHYCKIQEAKLEAINNLKDRLKDDPHYKALLKTIGTLKQASVGEQVTEGDKPFVATYKRVAIANQPLPSEKECLQALIDWSKECDSDIRLTSANDINEQLLEKLSEVNKTLTERQGAMKHMGILTTVPVVSPLVRRFLGDTSFRWGEVVSVPLHLACLYPVGALGNLSRVGIHLGFPWIQPHIPRPYQFLLNIGWCVANTGLRSSPWSLGTNVLVQTVFTVKGPVREAAAVGVIALGGQPETPLHWYCGLDAGANMAFPPPSTEEGELLPLVRQVADFYAYQGSFHRVSDSVSSGHEYYSNPPQACRNQRLKPGCTFLEFNKKRSRNTYDDACKALGLVPGCSYEAAKTSFHRLSLVAHSDKACKPNDKKCNKTQGARQIRLNRAYGIIRDHHKKNWYLGMLSHLSA